MLGLILLVKMMCSVRQQYFMLNDSKQILFFQTLQRVIGESICKGCVSKNGNLLYKGLILLLLFFCILVKCFPSAARSHLLHVHLFTLTPKKDLRPYGVKRIEILVPIFLSSGAQVIFSSSCNRFLHTSCRCLQLLHRHPLKCSF